MSLGIEVRDLTLRYSDVNALDGLSLQLDGGKIYGLLGRNGSGKTSLLSLLAAFRRPTSGQVLVGGVDPWENAETVRDICLIRESGDVVETDRVRGMVDFVARLRPNWDADYADLLLDRFRIPRKKRIQALSRGQKSALGITLGLASRAPLTMFDESYLGMDAPSRQLFYDELLSDYGRQQRTFILSTHLIEEVSPLFEQVVIIDNGRLVMHDDADTLRARGTSVTGPAEVVDMFVAAMTVLSEQRLGGTKSAKVYGVLDAQQRRRAEAAGLTLGSIGLQELFNHITASNDLSDFSGGDRIEEVAR